MPGGVALAGDVMRVDAATTAVAAAVVRIDRLQLVHPVNVGVEGFPAVLHPQPVLIKGQGREAVLVQTHGQVTAVDRTADGRDLHPLPHDPIIERRGLDRVTLRQSAQKRPLSFKPAVAPSAQRKRPDHQAQAQQHDDDRASHNRGTPSHRIDNKRPHDESTDGEADDANGQEAEPIDGYPEHWPSMGDLSSCSRRPPVRPRPWAEHAADHHRHPPQAPPCRPGHSRCRSYAAQQPRALAST